MKNTFGFGKVVRPEMFKGCKIEIEIELKENRYGYPVFSSHGTVWDKRYSDPVFCGQIFHDIEEVSRGNDKFLAINEMHSKYHLNDLHAGTKEQEDVLRSEGLSNASKYDEACRYLKSIGLYEVELDDEMKRYNPAFAKRPYKYGTGWLYMPIVDDDLKKIKEWMS